MSFQEKSAWILLVVSAAVGGLYGYRLWQAGTLDQEAWIFTAIGIFVVLAIIIHIVAAAISPKSSDVTDERDRQVSRQGDRVASIVMGGVVLLIIALSLKEQNWLIANIAFLGLLLAEVVRSLTQIISYRLQG